MLYKKFPVPADLKALRSFLGWHHTTDVLFLNFLLSPVLTRIISLSGHWTASKPLINLKQLPDLKREFLLETETDASKLGLGAALAQKLDDGLVRSHHSRKLNIVMRKIMGAQKWRPWLLCGR